MPVLLVAVMFAPCLTVDLMFGWSVGSVYFDQAKSGQRTRNLTVENHSQAKTNFNLEIQRFSPLGILTKHPGRKDALFSTLTHKKGVHQKGNKQEILGTAPTPPPPDVPH